MVVCCFIVRPVVPLFCISGDSLSVLHFKARGDSLARMLSRLMDSSDLFYCTNMPFPNRISSNQMSLL